MTGKRLMPSQVTVSAGRNPSMDQNQKKMNNPPNQGTSKKEHNASDNMDMEDMMDEVDKDGDNVAVEEFWADLRLEEGKIANEHEMNKDRKETQEVNTNVKIKKPTVEKPKGLSTPFE
ncbi:hypothetical protein Tco_1164519 [Tanacetum coccineum]